MVSASSTAAPNIEISDDLSGDDGGAANEDGAAEGSAALPLAPAAEESAPPAADDAPAEEEEEDPSAAPANDDASAAAAEPHDPPTDSDASDAPRPRRARTSLSFCLSLGERALARRERVARTHSVGFREEKIEPDLKIARAREIKKRNPLHQKINAPGPRCHPVGFSVDY